MMMMMLCELCRSRAFLQDQRAMRSESDEGDRRRLRGRRTLLRAGRRKGERGRRDSGRSFLGRFLKNLAT